jgi:hypothetical protein
MTSLDAMDGIRHGQYQSPKVAALHSAVCLELATSNGTNRSIFMPALTLIADSGEASVRFPELRRLDP